MKKYSFIAVIVLLTASSVFAQQKQAKIIVPHSEPFSVSPSKPMAGDEVTVTFYPEETILKNSTGIVMGACFITAAGDYFNFSSQPLTMKKEGGVWKATVRIRDTTNIVRIKFVGKEGEVHNEANGGYYLHVYDKNGAEDPNSQIAYIKMVQNPILQELTDADNRARLEFIHKMQPVRQLKQVFDAHPELKRKYFMSAYGSTVSRLRDKDYAAKEIKAISTYTNITESEYGTIREIYEAWKDSLQLDEQSLIKETLNKYPNGYFASSLYNDSLWQEDDLNRKIEILNNAKKKLKDDNILSLAYIVFGQMMTEKKYDMALDLFSNTVLPLCTTDFLKRNLYFIGNYVEPLTNVKIGLDKVVKLMGEGVLIARKELNNQTENEGKDWYLPDEWYNYRKNALCNVLIEYGDALHASGDDIKAMDSYAEVFKLKPVPKMERRNIDALETYVILLNKFKQYDKLKPLIEDAIKNGKDTYNMWDILKECYVKEHTVDKGYDEYFNKLESTTNSRKNNLKKELIIEQASDFALTDMNGKVIRLSSLKGNIVVLDFWGTWCGNCTAAFPGMQQVVNRFADKKDVKILFVDNERARDKKESEKRANDFLKGKGYNFHNLMDYDGAAAKTFKVLGYPTKLVIDKQGNIRFRMIGFHGSNKDLATELSTTIRMLQ